MSFSKYLWILTTISSAINELYLVGAGNNSTGQLGIGVQKIDQLNNGTVFNSYPQAYSNKTNLDPVDGYSYVAFNASIPVVSPDIWKTIHGSYQHCVAVKSDGTIYANGTDGFGQLGQGQINTGNTKWNNQVYWYMPVVFGAGDTNANFIDCGGGTSHSAGLKSDGTIWMWGDNTTAGVCANGTKTGNVLVPHNVNSTGFISGSTTVSLKVYNTFPNDTQFKKMSVGHRFMLALDQHGKIWAWGNNGNRQLGRSHRYLATDPTPNFTQDYYIRQTPNTDTLNGPSADPANENTGLYTDVFTEISAGAYHAGAITSDGRLIMWGSNSNGQCHSADTGLIMPHEVAKPAGKEAAEIKWSKLFCGEYSTAAILSDGSAWVWGKNSGNQLGVAVGDKFSAVQLTGSWLKIKIGLYHGMGIKTDGTLWSWGNNTYGQLGIGNTTASPSPTQVGTLNTWVDFAPLEYASQAIRR